MNSAVPGLSPDRLIWLPLLTLMAVALVADQARANLHAEARATAVAATAFDDPRSAEAWCRLHLDALLGDHDLGFEPRHGLQPSSAFSGDLPVSRRLSERPTRSADASL